MRITNFEMENAAIYGLSRALGHNACTICVIVANRFSGKEQYRNGFSLQLPVASSSNNEIVKAALRALREIYRPEFQYKRAGVFVSNIVPEGEQQYQLFDHINRDKQQQLMSAIDKINHSMGRNTVQLAVQGGEAQSWQGKCELVSNRYTTRWDEMLQVSI